MKIYLSPSLQEDNIGTGDYGTEQKRMNELCTILSPMLKKYGHTVYRNTPDMTLTKAINDSNNKKVDIHIALHSNGFNGTIQGAEIFHNKGSVKGKKLATDIYKYIESITLTIDRGVKESSTLGELKYTIAPAVIIEVGFHDNIKDANWIINNIPLIAESITKGINDYAGIKNIDTVTIKIDYEKQWYSLLAELKTIVNKYK